MSKELGWTLLCWIVTNSITLLTLVQPVNAQLPKVYKFTMVDTSVYSLFPVSLIRQDVRGSVQCAVLCSRTQGCFAYQYNTAEMSCSIGGDVASTGAALGANTRLFWRGYDGTVTCESESHDFAECVLSYPAVSLTLTKQLSNSDCTSGTTFGLTATGAVWVDEGCSGEFIVRF